MSSCWRWSVDASVHDFLHERDLVALTWKPERTTSYHYLWARVAIANDYVGWSSLMSVSTPPVCQTVTATWGAARVLGGGGGGGSWCVCVWGGGGRLGESLLGKGEGRVWHHIVHTLSFFSFSFFCSVANEIFQLHSNVCLDGNHMNRWQ